MTIQSFLVFLPAMLSGGLLIHLMWPERDPAALLLKASLGAGLGLGLSSILYFLSLLIAPGKVNLFPVTLAAFISLVGRGLAARARALESSASTASHAPARELDCFRGAGGVLDDLDLREPRRGTAAGRF